MGEVGSHLKKVAFRINPQVMYLLDWVFTLEVRIQDNFRKKKIMFLKVLRRDHLKVISLM